MLRYIGLTTTSHIRMHITSGCTVSQCTTVSYTYTVTLSHHGVSVLQLVPAWSNLVYRHATAAQHHITPYQNMSYPTASDCSMLPHGASHHITFATIMSHRSASYIYIYIYTYTHMFVVYYDLFVLYDIILYHSISFYNIVYFLTLIGWRLMSG